MTTQYRLTPVTIMALTLCVVLLMPGLAMGAPDAQKGGGTQAQPNAQPITYGQTVNGYIDNTQYEQVYSFQGQAGDTITISMTKSDPNLDPYLGLYNIYPSQSALITDDDAGGNYNALISGYRLPATGTYYIVATRFAGPSGSTSGAYSLTLIQGVIAPPPQQNQGGASFQCNGITVDTTALVTFRDVRPGFTYRVTVLGLNGLDPVIALYATDGSSLCNDDAPAAAGSVVDVPGVGAVSADSLTSQIIFTTSGAIGDIQMQIGGFGGSGGRFVAVFEGLAIAPSNELDAATITLSPAVQNDEVYVYMVSQYANLDPYMQLPARGIICDDAGTGNCAGVPAFSGRGVSIANGQTYVTGPYDAGIGVIPGNTDPLTFQFQSYGGASAGNYAMILIADTPNTTGGTTPGGTGSLDFSQQPNYGSQSLTSGFTPDPFTVPVTSGGSVDIALAMGSSCQGVALGYATSAPDFRLNYTAGSFPLRFFFNASGDTTLVINAPNGSWYCDDDSGGNLNPMIDFATPMSGQYDVWVGSYSSTDYVSGTLNITETSLTPGGGTTGSTTGTTTTGTGTLDYSQQPNYGSQSLTSGFTPDPFTVPVTSGGSVDIALAVGNSCQGVARGYAASAPDFRLNYTAGSFPLRFFFSSSGDTTLVINAPNGTWYCDDDSGGNLNPMIDFATPMSGQYDVWVGSYSSTDYVSGTLSITETSLTPTGSTTGSTTTTTTGTGTLDYSQQPNYGSQSLTAGFTPDPYTVQVTSGGSVDMYAAVGNSCQGTARGYATSAPDFRLNYTAGSFPLRFQFTSSQGDTTMVINAPNGTWYCDDDSAGNLNPRIDFMTPSSGQYDVWVGSYSSDAFISGQLSITEVLTGK